MGRRESHTASLREVQRVEPTRNSRALVGADDGEKVRRFPDAVAADLSGPRVEAIKQN